MLFKIHSEPESVNIQNLRVMVLLFTILCNFHFICLVILFI